MACLADTDMSVRRLDRRAYALIAMPVITFEAIDAVKEELADCRANLARLRRALQELRSMP